MARSIISLEYCTHPTNITLFLFQNSNFILPLLRTLSRKWSVCMCASLGLFLQFCMPILLIQLPPRALLFFLPFFLFLFCIYIISLASFAVLRNGFSIFYINTYILDSFVALVNSNIPNHIYTHRYIRIRCGSSGICISIYVCNVRPFAYILHTKHCH